MEKFDDLQDPSTNFPEHDPDIISGIFASEIDHMPSQNFFSRLEDTEFYRTFRREAISLFLQAQYSFNLDPFVTYLAMNYLDRFMSKRDLPQGNPWVTRLVQISCLSLATKMKNTPISSSDFQKGEGFVLEAQTVHKMELVILDTLQWRMRSITPFSFLHFFLSLLELNNQSFSQALKNRASCVIFNAHNEIEIVEFKPSIIAASAVLAACHELLPLQFASFQASISSCQYVNKESLFKCLNLVQDMIVKEGYESLSCTRTPVSVLDPRFTKSESENNISTTSSAATPGTCSTSMVAERRDSKRRRLNASLCSENRLHV